ncbi:hypothetical protein CQW23_03175 [Capsicum baccatum]|uniref:NB-ARC domain-containing protein n=1 Tax=Capsicum baccatum TaxID=33114 RepID=A0A2G2XB55_CAPBA|nr:hypothetical protein CQW23_03175 [Capsicum baccatum]
MGLDRAWSEPALVDAKEKQITNKAVKLWLEDLRDLVYDLDDVLDDLSIEILRCKIMTQFNSKKSKGTYDFRACIVLILGTGGVGKTTLAQLAYNDTKINDCFDLKICVCVSEVFDVFGITKLIFESVEPKSREIKGLNMLQLILKEKLSKNKFLIVLDDVWNENYDKWDLILSPLQVGLPGSKIVVMTRNEGVASVVSSIPPYRLKGLESDEPSEIICNFGESEDSMNSPTSTKVNTFIVNAVDMAEKFAMMEQTIEALKKSVDNKDYQITRLMRKLDLYNLKDSNYNLTLQQKS